MNTETTRETTSRGSDPGTEKPDKMRRWHRIVLGFCLVVFAIELGLFLLVFPWRRGWEMNWIPVHSPRFAGVWMSMYFRGAVSGLGLLNLVVALSEISKQVRSLISTISAKS